LAPSGLGFEELERSLVQQALEMSGWNKAQAARLLGMPRDWLRYRIEKHGLTPPRRGLSGTIPVLPGIVPAESSSPAPRRRDFVWHAPCLSVPAGGRRTLRTPRAQSIRTATLVAIHLRLAGADRLGAARAAPSPRGEDTTRQAQIERGKYLVTIARLQTTATLRGRWASHGPEPDMSRMLSGHPETMAMPPGPKADMPWGATAAALP
jgi:hypothetical protein